MPRGRCPGTFPPRPHSRPLLFLLGTCAESTNKCSQTVSWLFHRKRGRMVLTTRRAQQGENKALLTWNMRLQKSGFPQGVTIPPWECRRRGITKSPAYCAKEGECAGKEARIDCGAVALNQHCLPGERSRGKSKAFLSRSRSVQKSGFPQDFVIPSWKWGRRGKLHFPQAQSAAGKRRRCVGKKGSHRL